MCQMYQMPNIWYIWHTKHKIFDTVWTQMTFVLYYFFIIHLSLSSHLGTPSPLLRILPSLFHCPLSSEGWVPMWVYSSVGQVTVWVVGCGCGGVVGRSKVGCGEVGRGELGCGEVGHGEVGHGLTAKVSGF